MTFKNIVSLKFEYKTFFLVLHNTPPQWHLHFKSSPREFILLDIMNDVTSFLGIYIIHWSVEYKKGNIGFSNGNMHIKDRNVFLFCHKVLWIVDINFFVFTTQQIFKALVLLHKSFFQTISVKMHNWYVDKRKRNVIIT